MTADNSKSSSKEQASYHRIVVKAGTNVLTGGASKEVMDRMLGRGANGLDLAVMGRLVEQMARLRLEGREVLLVTSGAVAAGREALGQPKGRRDVPFRQMLAAVGQSRLMHTYQELFARHGVTVAQALLTRADVSDRLGYLNVRDSLLGLMELGVVPIVNENDVVTSEEIGDEVFGDNDTLSALVSNLVDADLLVMLGDTDGLYTADPSLYPEATLIPRVERIDQAILDLAKEEERHSWSRGGLAAKLEAARLSTSWGADVVIASGREPDVLLALAAGESRGTIFPHSTSKVESRERWLLSGPSASGEICVDDGAAEALRSQHRSLLPAGILEARGDFERHDVVLIVDKRGRKVACGVANYSARDVAAIKGLRSDRIQEALGHQYGDEVVHRNNLAVL